MAVPAGKRGSHIRWLLDANCAPRRMPATSSTLTHLFSLSLLLASCHSTHVLLGTVTQVRRYVQELHGLDLEGPREARSDMAVPTSSAAWT